MVRSGFFALAAWVVVGSSVVAQPINRADVKSGLVFTIVDAGGTSISRLEPGVGITLSAGEVAHPRSTGGTEFHWRGTINILQASQYQFDANLLGDVTVKVGEQVVLNASVKGDKAEKHDGKPVALTAGIQPFEVTLKRTGPATRVELIWRGPGFRPEPVPYFFFGHLPQQRPATFADDVAREHGRFLFEEHSCVKCHTPSTTDQMAKTLVERTGSNLAEIGKRTNAGWLDAWLADPHSLRPNTVMPKMFSDDETGIAERYAVVSYLVSLGGPMSPSRVPTISNDYQKSLTNGQKLYLTAGCAACHGDKLTQPPTKKKKDDDEDDKPIAQPQDQAHSLGTASAQGFYLLGAVGSKTTPEALARYLLNPLATNPHGRMPNMQLSAEEARDIARFLCRQTDEKLSAKLPATPTVKPATLIQADEKFATLKPNEQWKEAGKVLLATKGCVNCHAMEPGAPTVPSTAPKLATLTGNQGCLADKPSAAKVPVYSLDAKQKSAIATFLKDGLNGAGSDAPAYHAKTAMKRFNCLNCHNRDGEGGLSVDLMDQMRLQEKAENADDVSPPRLTGAGHKLRTSWFKNVLLNAGRARPWMTLRMPQYGEANVGHLSESLPKLEGTIADDSVGKVELTAANVEAGRAMTGKSGHGCISCHDISGITGGGTRGPDLARTQERVRYDWYTRWMHQPQRMAPGTKMPQNFIDGKALLTTFFDGDGDKQIEAMWAYFSLGQGLPLPSGMEPPKGLIVSAKDRPEILRTFMPEGAGTKAIAIGFPGGVNTVFDAATCRLSYAWSGNFLDASPVWNNRGGNPAKLLGPKFWTGPSGFPWATTESRTPPDFTKRFTDPAYGHQLPDDRFPGGPRHVHFAGYTLDAAGVPTFRYRLTEPDSKAELVVQEKITPLPVTVAAGLSRQFVVEMPAGQTGWLYIGTAAKAPRVYNANGTPIPLDRKDDNGELPAIGTRVVLPTDSNGATVFDLTTAPEGTKWRIVAKPDGSYQVLLRLPEPTRSGKADVTLSLWGLRRDDEALLKGLKAKN